MEDDEDDEEDATVAAEMFGFVLAFVMMVLVAKLMFLALSVLEVPNS